jgi:hypothetical protein
MGAKHSRNTPVLQLAEFDPELQKQVMDYIQGFDCGRSRSGFMNRRRGEIDMDTMQEILDSKEAMQSLAEIVKNYATSRDVASREFSSQDLSETSSFGSFQR